MSSPPSADTSTALVWLRRDLRADDHAALAAALARHRRVYCAFIFDTAILAPLPRCDRRVDFIRRALVDVDAALVAQGGGLIVRHADARAAIPALVCQLGVGAVYAARDYDPAAVARDAHVGAEIRRLASADFRLLKDQVIFERDEVLTGAGTPFGVFTPYKRAWLRRRSADDHAALDCTPAPGQLAGDPEARPLPTLRELGFAETDLDSLPLPTGVAGAQALFGDFLARLDAYGERRDFPALKGTSYLSAHLRFGTISIRQLVRHAVERRSAGADVWLSELIWRDFYQMILHHHPRVVTQCYQPRFDALRWRDDPARLEAWRQGRTGYPLVDAAMRQLRQSGYMHNRLRMLTASFLCKDLELDWRLGEAWFAEQLLDFDLAANNGGWQWVASTGCDAQPWFRIFNPITQSQKFDAQGKFIRRYLPELATVPDKYIHAPWTWSGSAGLDYPPPIVDHATARERTLTRYRAA